jgi:hypothetical protein
VDKNQLNTKRLIFLQGDDPPYLTVGTEVSAKYKGAFCEAKVRKVVRSVKCKVCTNEIYKSFPYLPVSPLSNRDKLKTEFVTLHNILVITSSKKYIL